MRAVLFVLSLGTVWEASPPAVMRLPVRRPNPNRGGGGHRHIGKRLLKRWLPSMVPPRPQQRLTGVSRLQVQSGGSCCPRATPSAVPGDHLGAGSPEAERNSPTMNSNRSWLPSLHYPKGGSTWRRRPEVWGNLPSPSGRWYHMTGAWVSGDRPPRSESWLPCDLPVSLGHSVNVLSFSLLTCKLG